MGDLVKYKSVRRGIETVRCFPRVFFCLVFCRYGCSAPTLEPIDGEVFKATDNEQPRDCRCFAVCVTVLMNE